MTGKDETNALFIAGLFTHLTAIKNHDNLMRSVAIAIAQQRNQLFTRVGQTLRARRPKRRCALNDIVPVNQDVASHSPIRCSLSVSLPKEYYFSCKRYAISVRMSIWRR